VEVEVVVGGRTREEQGQEQQEQVWHQLRYPNGPSLRKEEVEEEEGEEGRRGGRNRHWKPKLGCSRRRLQPAVVVGVGVVEGEAAVVVVEENGEDEMKNRV